MQQQKNVKYLTRGQRTRGRARTGTAEKLGSRRNEEKDKIR